MLGRRVCVQTERKKQCQFFFGIHSEKQCPERRKLWVAAIKRKIWTDKLINSVKLCSDTGKNAGITFDVENIELTQNEKD